MALLSLIFCSYIKEISTHQTFDLKTEEESNIFKDTRCM